MSSLQQLKRIRRFNDQRTANTTRALIRLAREHDALAMKISRAEAAMQEQSDVIARMRGETGVLLDRAAFFERKRREAALLAKRAEHCLEHEQLCSELLDLQEREQALQQRIVVLRGKDEKWQKAEGHFRRELSAIQARIEDRAIEGNVLCKQLIPIR